MSDAETELDGAEEEVSGKKGSKGMLVGVVLALIAGGGGFFAASNNLIPGLSGEGGAQTSSAPEIMLASTTTEFVAIDRMVISLGKDKGAQYLNFGAALEVVPEHKEEVTNLLPRVLDILNTYLRAVELRDIENPAAMTRLRAQMLRRVNIVTGEGRIKDLLITEFVLN